MLRYTMTRSRCASSGVAAYEQLKSLMVNAVMSRRRMTSFRILGLGLEVSLFPRMYNDITARSANIQAGIGVVLVFLLLGLRTRVQNNLMCTIDNSPFATIGFT